MVQEYYNNIKFLVKNKFNARLVLTLSLIVLISSFIIDIRPIFAVAILCALNVGLLVYDRYVELPIDIELSTFSAVIMTVKFGLFWGVFAGLLTKIAAMISNRDFNSNSMVSLTAYALAGFLASIFSGLPFMTLGIIVSVLANVYIVLFERFILYMSSYEIAMYSISNVMFNIIIFIAFSNIIGFFLH